MAARRFGESAGQAGELGPHVSGAWVGCVNDTSAREASSSGGLATWTLGRLLDDGVVDGVLCVSEAAERLYDYRLITSSAQLDACRGSAYYPADLGECLKSARRFEGKLAVVGLPCALKGVARALESDPALRERVIHLVGLACGQMKSEAFTECLSLAMGLSAHPSSVRYRVKSRERSADRFAFRIIDDRGSRDIVFDGVPALMWGGHWFTVPACHYCDDLFADVADVTFMDAWLDEYTADWRGTSIAVVRKASLAHYFRDAEYDSQRSAAPIDPQKVLDSQRGAWRDKREGLAHRLWLARQQGRALPGKRVSPTRASNAIDRFRWNRQVRDCERTLGMWAAEASSHSGLRWAGRIRQLARVTRLERWGRRLVR